MNEEEWKKAIHCTKEELIEWLCEMYNDERMQRSIIRSYEKQYKPYHYFDKDKQATYVDTKEFSYYKKGW